MDEFEFEGIELPLVRRLPRAYSRSPILARHAARLERLGIETTFDQRADLEDSIELAARTEAILESDLFKEVALFGSNPNNGPLPGLNGPDEPETGLDVGILASDTNPGTMFRRPRHRPLLPNNPAYWESPAFRGRMGRATILAKNSNEDDAPKSLRGLPHAPEAARRLGALLGTEVLMTKIVGGRLKAHGVDEIEADSQGSFNSAFGYNLLGAWNLASLVQEKVEMCYEYRLLVVDWEIVGGAGTIASLTADDADPTRRIDSLFDVRVTRTSRGSPIEDRPDIVAGHIAFGRDLLTAVKAEGKLEGTMTIDVFLRGGSNAGVRGAVEANPLGLAGWYAADPRPVVDAIGRATKGMVAKKRNIKERTPEITVPGDR